MKTGEWIMTEAVGQAPQPGVTVGSKYLPQGSHVKPVQRKYVPNDIFERMDGSKYFDDTRDVIIYTAIGMIIVKLGQIRKVD